MTVTAVVSALSDQLRDGVDVHRCAAARALGKIADPDTVEVLCQALLDEDPDVRTDAAAALGNLADAQSAEKLMDNLIGDPCCDVKISAIEALVRLRYEPVIPWLKRLVAGRDEEIAWDEEEFHGGSWDDWLDVQLAAICGLGMLGAADGVPEIVAAFDDEMGQDVSEHAIDALCQLDEPGAAALMQLYENGERKLRRRVASAVAASSRPEHETLRNRCLIDNSVDVRRAAALALAGFDPENERLAAVFDDRDAELRKQIVERCGASFPDKTREKLEDPVPAVKCAAFRVVANRPDLFEVEGFDEVIRSNVGGHPLVSGEAAKAWTALVGERALAPLNTSFSDIEQPVPFRRLLIEALRQLDGRAVEVLAKAAGDDDRQIRIDTLTALAGIAAKESEWPGPAGQVLLAAFSGDLVAPPAEEADAEEPDADEAERTGTDEDASDGSTAEVPATDEEAHVDPGSGAASTLDVILNVSNDAGTVEEEELPSEFELTDEDRRLMELAERRAISKKKVSLDVEIAPYQDVRRFAAQLLGDIADEAVAEHLIAALDEDDAELRQAAINSLALVGEQVGHLPDAAFEPLISILGEGAQELRMPAVRALARIRTDDVSEQLRDLLGDEDIHVRLEALRGLDQRGEVGDDIRALLQDNYPGIRLAAATALAHAQGAGAVDALVAFAFDHDGMYRHEAGKLLSEVAPHEASDLFLAVLTDDARRREWLVAIDALGEIGAFGARPEKLVAA